MYWDRTLAHQSQIQEQRNQKTKYIFKKKKKKKATTIKPMPSTLDKAPAHHGAAPTQKRIKYSPPHLKSSNVQEHQKMLLTGRSN